MTAQDYVDEFVNYLADWYCEKEKANTTDVDEIAKNIRVFDEDNCCADEFVRTHTSRDFVDAFECYDLIRELEFTEWNREWMPENIWQLAEIALNEVFEYEDTEKLYRRCAEKILSKKEELK